MKRNTNISIVLYNSDFDEINNLVELLGDIECVNKIYLIDNSRVKNQLFYNCNAIYIFNDKNIGYGAGHNMAIKESIHSDIKYHLVLNPDVSFGNMVLLTLVKKIAADNCIGMVMPKVLNADGTVQLLPKLLPSPHNLLLRAIPVLRKLFDSVNIRYTLRNFQDAEINVPIISGCFSLFRVEALKEIGLYDESYFMYFEDFDLSRRIHSRYKTLYYPEVSIIHEHERGAAKSLKLFRIFVKSAIIYFNKYGWFFDAERKRINKNVLEGLK